MKHFETLSAGDLVTYVSIANSYNTVFCTVQEGQKY